MPNARPTRSVVFSRNAHEFVCEAMVHLSTGLTAQAKAHANEIYAAFDACSEKMEKQLRRYKRRLKDHHRERSQPVELSGASSYILAGSEDDSEARAGNAAADDRRRDGNQDSVPVGRRGGDADGTGGRAGSGVPATKGIHG